MSWFSKIVPHPCIYIDSNFSSNITNLESLCYIEEDDESFGLACESLQDLWDKDSLYSTLPCLSVRSAFDLFLSVKAYPIGSEIIMSAVNINGMFNIAQHHGLVVRPCDINISTMEPSLTHLKSLVTEKTKLVLVAHLYGITFNIDEVSAFCKSRDLFLIEDCAETFNGISNNSGNKSDLKLYSFGTIKTATVFGGAICRFKDKDLYEKIRDHQMKYPKQTKKEYFNKLTKYSMLTLLMNSPLIFRYGIPLFKIFRLDHKQIFVPMLRGFPHNFFTSIRKRPSVSLINNLYIRIREYDENNFTINKNKGDYMMSNLPKQVMCVGREAFKRSYWLFPVLVEDPDTFVKKMNDLGVDASRDSTQLKCFADKLTIPSAKFLMEHVVYLPVHRLVKKSNLDKIISSSIQAVEELKFSQLLLPSTKT